MTHPARIAANNLEAARILDAHGERCTAAFLRNLHPQQRAAAYHALAIPRGWRACAPPLPGTYHWRRSSEWESIVREIPASRMLFSHRYEKEVPAEYLGGEWLY